MQINKRLVQIKMKTEMIVIARNIKRELKSIVQNR